MDENDAQMKVLKMEIGWLWTYSSSEQSADETRASSMGRRVIGATPFGEVIVAHIRKGKGRKWSRGQRREAVVRFA